MRVRSSLAVPGVLVAQVAQAGDVCAPPQRRDCDALAAQMQSCQTVARSSERHGGLDGSGYGVGVGVNLGGSTASETVPCTPETVDRLLALSVACGDAASGHLGADAYWVMRGNLTEVDYLASCAASRSSSVAKKCGRKEAFDGRTCRPLLDVTWQLTVESLNVTQARRDDGTQWDNGSVSTAAPDIYLTAALTQTTCDDAVARTRLWSTPTVQDSFRPAFSATGVVGRLDYDSRLCVIVTDSDPLSSEVMHVFDLQGKELQTMLEWRRGELEESFGRLVVAFEPAR